MSHITFINNDSVVKHAIRGLELQGMIGPYADGKQGDRAYNDAVVVAKHLDIDPTSEALLSVKDILMETVAITPEESQPEV